MIIYSPPAAAKFVPVIDLADTFSNNAEAKRAVAWEIHKACRDIGFFYIKNHGIPEGMLQAQIECARRFFSLPQSEKDEIALSHSPTMRGYEPMALQTLDEGSKPDIKEGFYASVDSSQSYVTNGAYDSLNQWPKSYPEMRVQVECCRRPKTDSLKGLVPIQN